MSRLGGDVADYDARTFAADGIRLSFFVLAAASRNAFNCRGFAGHMLQDVREHAGVGDDTQMTSLHWKGEGGTPNADVVACEAELSGEGVQRPENFVAVICKVALAVEMISRAMELARDRYETFLPPMKKRLFSFLFPDFCNWPRATATTRPSPTRPLRPMRTCLASG